MSKNTDEGMGEGAGQEAPSEETVVLKTQVYGHLSKFLIASTGDVRATPKGDEVTCAEDPPAEIEQKLKITSSASLKRTLKQGLKELNARAYDEVIDTLPKGESNRRNSVQSGSSGSSDSSLDFDSEIIKENLNVLKKASPHIAVSKELLKGRASEGMIDLEAKRQKKVKGEKQRQTPSKSERQMVSMGVQSKGSNERKGSLTSNLLLSTDPSPNELSSGKGGNLLFERQSTTEEDNIKYLSDFADLGEIGALLEEEENEFLASSRGLAVGKRKISSSIAVRMMKTKVNRNYFRRLVSQNRKRYVDKAKGYDLDLVYVTPSLIAMGHPSRGIEILYRNSYSQVMKFFEESHKGHYRIYNLCMKRKYPLKVNVEHYGFCDHNACPLTKLYVLLDDIDQWLNANEQNVAVVHCKAGKGRTGLVSSCYLLRMGKVETAKDAIEYFGDKRTMDGRGLTVASQRRYVYYYEKARSSEIGTLPKPDMDVRATVEEEMTHIFLHQRVRMPAHSSPKFYLSKVEIRNIPAWLRSWRQNLILKFAAGVPAGVTPLGKTKAGDFLYPSQIEAQQQPVRKPSTRRRKAAAKKGRLNSTGKHEKTLVWSSDSLRSVSNTWFLSMQDKGDVATSVPEVQGDFRITALHDGNMNMKSKKTRKLFQLWLNTNFFKVQYGDCLLESYETDFVWQNAKPAAGFSSFKVELPSVHRFDKFGLDGKLSKDLKHKNFPENFEVVFHFRLSPEQPIVRDQV